MREDNSGSEMPFTQDDIGTIMSWERADGLDRRWRPEKSR